MAFTSRAKRFNAEESELQDVDVVGPGSYELAEKKNTHASYAPFSTSEERGLLADENIITPGPGSYVVESKPKLKYSAVSNAFVSRVTRFDDHNHEENPGPGSYQLSDDWTTRNNRPYSTSATVPLPIDTADSAVRSQTSAGVSGPLSPSIQFVRLPTAPSIPILTQSFGYDENSTGELIARTPAEKVYSGVKLDTVGPAYYSPDLKAVRPSRATSFGASETRRVAFRLLDNPGPGQYDLAGGAKKKRSRKPMRQSHMFQSCMKRWDELRLSDTPGPGSYTLDDEYVPKDEIPDKFQGFGSMAVRLDKSRQGRTIRRTTSTSDENPGPGTYSYRSSDFQSVQEVKTKAASIGLPSKAPFQSTSRRFACRNNRIPGPGSYQEAAQRAHRRFAARHGVFGSTARRFTYKYAEGAPGPGAYYKKSEQAATGRSAASRSAPSSVFVSTSSRFTKILEEAPPVGAYDLKSKWIKENAHSKRKQFLFSEKRFREQEKLTSARLLPGPGSYDLTGAHEQHNPASAAFRSHQARFARNAKDALPGPGHYSPRGADTMLKRSYNITIDGDEY